MVVVVVVVVALETIQCSTDFIVTVIVHHLQ